MYKTTSSFLTCVRNTEAVYKVRHLKRRRENVMWSVRRRTVHNVFTLTYFYYFYWISIKTYSTGHKMRSAAADNNVVVHA